MPLTIMTSTTQTNAELATYNKDNKNDKQLNWLFLDLKGCKLIGDIVKDYKQGWGGAKDPVPYPRDGWIVLGKLNLIFIRYVYQKFSFCNKVDNIYMQINQGRTNGQSDTKSISSVSLKRSISKINNNF